MLVKYSWLASLLAAVSAQEGLERCGTAEPDMEVLANAAAFAKEEGFVSGDALLRPRYEPVPIVIPTYFHLLAVNETTEGGWVSEDVLIKQLDVLNEDFAPHNISFELKEINRMVHVPWSQNQDVANMKRTLRRGAYDSLNVYYQQYVSGNLGYCTYPRAYAPGSTGFFNDGCNVLTDSLPGGPLPRFELGKTATHEVGHWMNLFHTFQGACSCAGDMIHDTPASESPSWGCPVGRDSCPTRPGLDPIHNYMDYSDDYCFEEFTEGQAWRMRSAWWTFRAQ